MDNLRRDPSATPEPAGPGSAASSASRKVRHLSIVPNDADRPRAAPTPLDWASDIRRVAETQDRAAFSRLFSHFAPRVKSYLVRTGSIDEQAEEIAQEALVMVWRKAALFDPRQAGASTWIFTIARNLRVDAARRHRIDLAGDECFEFDSLPADQPGVAEGLDAARMADRVRDALSRLPPEQAQVLRLSFYDDEPHARIAAELGIPLGTVKSRMRLGVARLRRLLDL